MKDAYRKSALLVCAVFFLMAAYGCTALKKSPDGTGKNEEYREVLRIERFKEKVRREGDTLYLKIEYGAYLTLKNSRSCLPPSPCDYEFVDYYSEPGFYLVFVGYCEGEDYILISEKDGKIYSVKAMPGLSPDKERFVSVSACEVYCKSGVFIWRIADNRLVPEFFYEPEENARYSFIKWKDDRTIELDRVTYSSEEICPESDFMTVPVSFRLEDGEWRFCDDSSRRNVRCGPIR